MTLTAAVEDKKNGAKPSLRTRMIALCGTASSLKDVPVADKDFEIWAISQCLTATMFAKDRGRVDRMFEMHNRDYWGAADILERLNRFDCPVYMQDHYAEVPKSVSYPIDRVCDLGDGRTVHANFSSSIAYMLALAAHEAAQGEQGAIARVNLYGIHMSAEEEFSHQRAACAYWMGVLGALGVSVTVSGDGDDMLHPPYRYGYETNTMRSREIAERYEGLVNGRKELEEQLQEARDHLQRQEGAIKECAHWRRRNR